MSFFTLMRKQFTPTKLFFHFLFWTFHWGIFAYGWYAFSETSAAVAFAVS
jgi:NADPH oxidase